VNRLIPVIPLLCSPSNGEGILEYSSDPFKPEYSVTHQLGENRFESETIVSTLNELVIN
jgi:hypothetical protein